MSIVTVCEKAADTDPWPNDWRDALKRAVRSVDELAKLLDLPPDWAGSQLDDSSDFPLLVTREYASRIRRGDPSDPLLLQVAPQRAERASVAGFTMDAVGDAAASLIPGLLQKYSRRALLVVTGACAIHCRYCFRRHFPYQESPPQWSTWNAALAEVQSRPSIDELILSGGDPLMLSDEVLGRLVERIESIPQLRRLRIHTRLPIVLPQRVTERLLDVLGRTRLTSVVVIHTNHAQEIDDLTAAAIDRLRDARVTLLNQSVLLRGVNDSVDALEQLSRRLVDLGVLPYYLHLLDRTQGTHAFEVTADEGRAWMEQLRDRLPGYAVPRLAREIVGHRSKDVLA